MYGVLSDMIFSPVVMYVDDSNVDVLVTEPTFVDSTGVDDAVVVRLQFTSAKYQLA